jgi:hypothetical protein
LAGDREGQKREDLGAPAYELLWQRKFKLA